MDEKSFCAITLHSNAAGMSADNSICGHLHYTGGADDGFADAYISNDPFLMLSYYKNADLVITNTFHGNIFSIIYNKQFISRLLLFSRNHLPH